MQHRDVIIAGAGIIGLSIAYHLAKQGVRITLLDPDLKGGRGSRAAAGVTIPSMRSSNDPGLADFAHQGLRALEADLEQLSSLHTIERRGQGIIRLAQNEAARLQIEAQAEKIHVSPGIFYTGADLAQVEPVLIGSSVYGGFVHEEGYVIDAGAYLDALLYEVTRQGVEVRLGDAALAIHEEEQHVTVQTLTEVLTGDRFILAAGAWSNSIMGLPPLPVVPLRGQMLVVAKPPLMLKRVISGRGYLVPWQRGGIMVGATEENAAFLEHNTPDGLLYLLSVLSRLAPSLREARVTTMWAGLRAATTNGRPLIGPLPGMSRVIVATGHTGQGILTGALTGKVVAELVTTGHSDVAAAFGLNSKWE